MIIFQFAIFLG